MHLRQLASAPLDHVGHEPHRRLGREDELFLRDVLLEDVGLHRPAQRLARHTLPLTDADVEREQDRRRRVDRHRRRNFTERNPLEQRRHVLERVDRHALAPDLALRPRVVRVVPHQRRHVECRRQPGLPVLEQVPEPRVRLGRRPESRELPHRPGPPAVHRLVHATRERKRARQAQVTLVVELDVGLGVERLDLDPGDRRMQLSRAYVSGRRHRDHSRSGPAPAAATRE